MKLPEQFYSDLYDLLISNTELPYDLSYPIRHHLFKKDFIIYFKHIDYYSGTACVLSSGKLFQIGESIFVELNPLSFKEGRLNNLIIQLINRYKNNVVFW